MTSVDSIRQALRRTWVPFFSRFGRLTYVQIRTIPKILARENLVVISPAASGKTEGVVAPVVERLLAGDGAGAEGSGQRGLGVLYVSPTRALVNDLYRRLAEPIEYLGLTVSRKTGDHPDIDEKRLPFLLLTTPESFDSLLCRHTAIFRQLATVILDELHLLDNTPRGDQLRVLLERLRLVNPNLTFHALSATIDDLDIGQRYFSNPTVVAVPAQREISVEYAALGDNWEGELLARLQCQGCRKALIFFNARSAAEKAVKLLDRPPFAGRCWVHHGSLNKAVRETVEQAMNRERTGLLCCTSTLELGIDIGDIDAVVLVRPPFSVSSLLQRLGRGNRRSRLPLPVIALYANAWERMLFETFFDCARTGRLYEKRYTPSLAVLPQQILSYAFQRRRVGMTRESCRRALAPLVTDERQFDMAFRHLVETGALVASQEGIYHTGTAVERQVESGKVHSNIQDKSFGEYEVRDVTTNQQIGTVFFVYRHFVLAGRSWELVERDEKRRRLLVRPLAAATTNTQVFEGTGTGGYYYRLATVLKQRLFPDLAEQQFPYFRYRNEIVLVHLLGQTYGYILAEALALRGKEVADMDGKLLLLTSSGPAPKLQRFPAPDLGSIREVVRGALARLEDSLGSGAFFRFLPEELQVEDHLLALDISGLLGFLPTIEPVELSPEQVTEAMRMTSGRVSERASGED